MDRIEVANFTTVTDLVDQDCTFSLPVKGEFDLVDLNRNFIQGGSVTFSDKYRLSNSQACVLFMERLFPVPTCVYEEDEDGEQSDTPKEIRTEAQASTLFGITDPSTLGEVQQSSVWEAATNYEGSKSYEYWNSNNAINNNISYTNILDECDISFYGLPKGEAYICSWVNGGSVLCNNLNFFAINSDAPPPVDEEDAAYISNFENPMESRNYGCYLIIDGQDASLFPSRQDNIPIEQTVKNQNIKFINFDLSAEEQWYHAYFVQPVAYRLTFQDLEVYQMNLVEPNSEARENLPPPPVKRPELQQPVFDYSSMEGNCIYSYSSITAYGLPIGVGGSLIFPSLESIQSRITASYKIKVLDATLTNLSTMSCTYLVIGNLVMDSSTLTVGEEGGDALEISATDSTIRIDNVSENVFTGRTETFSVIGDINVDNSNIAINFLYTASTLYANNNSSINIGKFEGSCELENCTANFDTFIGNCDIRDMDGWSIGDLYEKADGTFLRADGRIRRVYAYDVITVNDCVLEVDEWYGTLPGVSNNAAVNSGYYSPNLPPFPPDTLLDN